MSTAKESYDRDTDRREALSAMAGEFAAASDDPSVLLPLVARRVSEVFGDLCVIRLVSADGEYLEACAVHHPDPDMLAAVRAATVDVPQRVGEGMIGEVAATGKPLLMPVIDTELLAAKLEEPRRALVLRQRFTSLVVAPLVAEGRTVGVISITSTDPSRPFDEVDLRLVKDLAGHLALMLEKGRAFAAQRVAHSETERMRALLAAIVESSNDAIVSKRLDGTITSWNAAAERLFGYAPEEVIGRPITLLIPSDRLDEETAMIARLTAGDRVDHYETARLRKDGSEVFVSLSLAPILEASGKVVGVSKTARDLTSARRAADALRRTEDQLRQAQKMEAVGRLAGGIAHDFNNVLSVVLGYSALLLEDLEPGGTVAADVEQIHKAAEQATNLTRQLLLFTRQQVFEPRVLDLNDALADMDKMLRYILGEDVDLACLHDAKSAHIRADPGNIEQVIMNLVVNARDAMPTGGKLTIETANVELGADYAVEHFGSRPGPHVMLAITDTGTGMDAATQSRIFEPFFTTKGLGKGTGLGLSTVFGIAQQCGGSVWVYSELGRGTTFKVYFPRVEEDVHAAPPGRKPTSLRGSETILLVEDQEQVRAVAAGILARNGYRVIVAASAEDALTICSENDGIIHLLLTDVVMPQLSGAELVKRATATRPAMKVLCMSGYTDDSIVRHGVLEGGIAFLQKPFTPASLTRRVREVLDPTQPPS